MASGDLTGTMVGQAAVGSAALKTLIDGVNLATTTDTLHLVPTANGTSISVVKVAREA
jgi:hypothetical protein|tara:strand:- start:29 stop:202 length:174 start_codon:yes stop_codon:yes gene_type:complete